MLYFTLQAFTLLIKAYLASKLFINTVLEAIAIEVNTQHTSSGYQKPKGSTQNPRVRSQSILKKKKKSLCNIFMYCKQIYFGRELIVLQYNVAVAAALFF